MADRSSLPPRPLLIVDDCQDGADSLALLATAWGYEPLVAYDGDSALRLAAERSPGAAVVDITMPGMDGYEVALALRQMPGLEHSLLVAMSGYAEGRGRRAPEGDFDLYLLKPVDPGELQRILAAHVTDS